MSSDPPSVKTERWDQTIETYLKSTDEWVARCRARVLQLDAVLKTDEADKLVWEMSQLQRWRAMGPERAADQLCHPIARFPGSSDEE